MTIRVHKFWTTFAPDPKDPEKLRGVDMVAYHSIGQAQYSVQIEAVSRLSKLIPLEGNEDNIAVVMAHDRWNQIKGPYDAFKHGNELPEDGTPLAAWSGLTPEQADEVRRQGIRTVEEFAELPENVVNRLPMQHGKKHQAIAKTWLATLKDQAQADQMEEMKAQAQAQEQELAELRETLARMQQAAGDPTGEAIHPVEEETPKKATRKKKAA